MVLGGTRLLGGTSIGVIVGHGIILEIFVCRFGAFLIHSGITLGSYWGHDGSRVHFGGISGSSWSHLGSYRRHKDAK